jgi:hypothetical protein
MRAARQVNAGVYDRHRLTRDRAGVGHQVAISIAQRLRRNLRKEVRVRRENRGAIHCGILARRIDWLADRQAAVERDVNRNGEPVDRGKIDRRQAIFWLSDFHELIDERSLTARQRVARRIRGLRDRRAAAGVGQIRRGINRQRRDKKVNNRASELRVVAERDFRKLARARADAVAVDVARGFGVRPESSIAFELDLTRGAVAEGVNGVLRGIEAGLIDEINGVVRRHHAAIFERFQLEASCFAKRFAPLCARTAIRLSSP